MATPERDDVRLMRHALALADRGLGNVWPNPAVGCVLTGDGRLVGRGWTQPGGRPHVELEALARAGASARGASAHVTLEPCNHHGRTPPCAEALIEAGVARVVVATEDPDPRVRGGGIRRLRESGIEVEVGVLEAEARELNAGFIMARERGRPFVTLKLATTLDGRIASRTGASRWITGEAARAHAHLMRARHDAILIGSGTALADDPALTCRLPGLERRSPVRVVVDGACRLPADSQLARTAGETSTWVLTRGGGGDARAALATRGVELIEVAGDGAGHVDLEAALRALGLRGITRAMVEGGRGLATALLRAKLVDRIEWFRAPSLIGEDGLAALGELGVESMADVGAWVRRGVLRLGDDLLESFAPRT